MALTLAQIRSNTAKARELMERARNQHFAVGAFNIDNQETLIAICEAAQAKNAPVLVEVSHGEVQQIGHDNLRDMVDNYIQQYDIEMFINLDHSPSIEAAKRGIDAGYELIHIDISQARKDASDEEIVRETKEVVQYAKFTGALVESEPHYFGGSSNVHEEAIDYDEIRKTFSTPEGAKEFVDATGIDTFAAAIGNLHGSYPVPKQLDIELLKQIKAAIDCNISLHGGSGTPGHFYEEAAHVGVEKININTDLRVAFRTTLERVLRENPSEYAIMKLMPDVWGAVREVVENKIDTFGSANKSVGGKR